MLVCNGEIFNYRELRRGSKPGAPVLDPDRHRDPGAPLRGRRPGPRPPAQRAVRLRPLGPARGRLLLARDHFGVSPLHFAVTDGLLVFGSEIKAILEHPAVAAGGGSHRPGPDPHLPGLVSPRTLFKGVESLESGHSLPSMAPTCGGRILGPGLPRTDETGEAGRRAITSRDAGAVHPLGGGPPAGRRPGGLLPERRDRLVAGRRPIRQVSPDADRHSFSITFEDGRSREAPYQRLMAEHVGSRHHEIGFDDASIADRMSRMVLHCECPVKETFNTCALALSEAVRGTGVKVVLAGQGADEIFARLHGLPVRQPGAAVRRRVRPRQPRSRTSCGNGSGAIRGIFYEKELPRLAARRGSALYWTLAGTFDEIDCTSAPLVDQERLRGRHPVHQRSYLDFKLRLSEHLLSDHGDRMVMANSVEGRYPFLDRRGRGVRPPHAARPQAERVYGEVRAQKMAAGLLPRRIIEREKFGFRAPSRAPAAAAGDRWVQDLLSYDRIRRQGYFDPDVVERLKQRYSKRSSS